MCNSHSFQPLASPAYNGRKELNATSHLSRRSRLRPFRLLIAVLAAVLAAAISMMVVYAWRRTTLREAYVPQLEAAAGSDPDVLSLLGARLVEAGRFGDAIPVFQRAAIAGERDPNVWRLWAASLLATGDLPRGYAALKTGVGRGVPNLQAVIEELQQNRASLTPAGLAHRICPDGAAPVLSQRACGSFLNPVLEYWGRTHPAKSGYATRENWVKAEPQNANVQRLWGEALLQNGAWLQAIEPLGKALSLQASSPEAHLDMADALLNTDHDQDAENEYLLALHLRPNWLPALLGQARCELDSGHVENATALFEQATHLAPSSADAWIGLGQADLLWKSRAKQTVEAFERAAQLAPGRTDFFVSYARALRTVFRPQDAERALRKRLVSAPEDMEAHYLLGVILSQGSGGSGRLADAERELKTAASSGRAEVKMALGQVLLQEGRPAEAIPLLQEAVVGNPINVVALNTLAEAFDHAGRSQDAASARQRASWATRVTSELQVLTNREKGDPSNVDTHLKLASIFGSLGMKPQAEQEQQFIARLRSPKTERPSGAGQPAPRNE